MGLVIKVSVVFSCLIVMCLLPAAVAEDGAGGGVVVADLEIGGFDPPGGGPGTIVTILGKGFGADPAAICAVVQAPDRASIPLQVLDVSPDGTQIRAVLGAVPGAEVAGPKPVPWKPAPIIVAIGRGAEFPLEPAFDDVVPEGPAWIWRGDPLNAPLAISRAGFQPIPEPAPERSRQFISQGVDARGQLQLRLDGDWPSGSVVSADLRLSSRELGVEVCLRIPRVRFESGAPADQIGPRVCDLLRSALELQAIPLDCQLIPDIDGSLRLSVGLMGGAAQAGHLSILVTEPEDVGEKKMQIDGFEPRGGGFGTLLTIRGSGFGSNPQNLAAAIVSVDGAGAANLKIIAARDEEVLAVVGAISPGFKPGPILIAQGEGASEVLPPLPPFEVFGPASAWASLDAGPWAFSDDEFTPGEFTPRFEDRVPLPEPRFDVDGRPIGPPDGCFYGVESEGGMRLRLPSELPEGAALAACGGLFSEASRPGADEPDIGGLGVGFRTPLLRSDVSLGGPEVAALVSELLTQTLALRGLAIAFEVVESADGAFELQIWSFGIELPPPAIAALDLCIWLPELPKEGAVEIEEISADELVAGDMVTIAGRGFGNDPDDLSVSAPFPEGGGIPMTVLDANDRRLEALVGPLPFSPDGESASIRVVLGDGERRMFDPNELEPVDPADPIDPASVLEPIESWVWIGNDANAEFSKPVDFLPAFPAGGGVGDGGGASDGGGAGGGLDFCLYGRRDGGDMKLSIAGSWASGTEIKLYLRFTGNSGSAYQLETSRFILGGGTARQNAFAMLGVIQTSFLLLHGVVILGQVEDVPGGTVNLRVGVLNDSIQSGYLIACGSYGSGAPGILPGDCNIDRRIDLSDPLCMLGFLFLGMPSVLPCGDPGGAEPDPGDVTLLDVDGSGELDLTDPVRVLTYLFLGGPPHTLGTDCVQIATCPERCQP